ncbi:MAG: heavy metal translocating P-type ATPase [Treponema sp.]|nr:heavy metal translocating P-type ATPase [Treponema sp.]
MQNYEVTGMSCAACVARVEKAVSKVPGVTSCSVNLLTNSMVLEGTASESEIISAVEKAGYGAKNKNAGKSTEKKSDQDDFLKDKETPVLKKRLFTSLGFLAILMYISMGHMMWNWPLPVFMKDNHVMMGLSQLLLAAIIMVINQKFFVSGFKSLFHRSPNMDTLVALGSSASFIYSTIILFLMTHFQSLGESEKVMELMHEFYFESAAMILTLITVGKMLEAKSKGKTTNALKSLMKLAPQTATVIRDGKEVEVPVEDVQAGDIFTVRPGENIAVDGIVVEGTSAVNEASLTGESIPSEKIEGSKVSSGTFNTSGFLKCRATAVGSETTLSKIIQMVSESAATKAPIAKIADKVSGIFVPVVICIAVVTIAVWLLLGKEIGFALARGISVLVISCPCALGLATPVAIMVGNGMGARNGILFKNSVTLEQAGKINIVAFDKTGTITKGTPEVTDIFECTPDLLKLAASLEAKSEHPLAKAVLEKAEAENIGLMEVTDFNAVFGKGLEGVIEGKKVFGGNKDFIGIKTKIPEEALQKADSFSESGKTPLFFATETGTESEFLGIIAVSDTIKEESAKAISQLKNMGIKTIMLTGDNEKTASSISKQAGIDEVYAGVLPSQKAEIIKKLKAEGVTCMTGDGINDAVALTEADVGIAIGTGTDVAVDAAQIVLMKDSLLDVPAAIRLSRKTLLNIKENLFWAFIYNTIGIPLAAGVFINLFGWKLNPMFGALAMSLSSFCVVTNALRLNLAKIYNSTGDKKIRNKSHKKEKSKMEKTLNITGMMCGHCEAHVKKALEAVAGVTEAVASHEKGTAVVTLSQEVSNDVLTAAVKDAGYEVTGIN